MFGNPPDIVPDDLSAREYHLLARWYEASKMQPQARAAYEKQLCLEASGTDADAARFALKVRLTEDEIPADVTAEIARSGFLLLTRPADAKKLALKTIQNHPTCGSAHRLLAEVYLSESNPDGCIDSLRTSLKYNANDLQSLIIMARVHCAIFDYAAARKFINEAAELSPTNEAVRGLRRTIDVLSGMDDESCPISEQVAVLTKRLRTSRLEAKENSPTPNSQN